MGLAIRQSVPSNRETIYWPGSGPPRGVVCLHGSEGGWVGWNDLNCALFAAHGFAALARNYSPPGAGSLARPDIDDVPLEGTVAALDALRAELAPYGCGVGLFGASRGAEHALLLAQLLAEDDRPGPNAVALHSPPDATWPAFIVADFQTGRPWAGNPQRPAWSWRGGHERTRPGTPLGTGAYFRPVFIAQGTADKVWDAEMARRLVAQMTEAGCPPEAHFFEGEGHIFQAAARNREWELMIEFFGRHLSPGEPSKRLSPPLQPASC